MILVLHEMQAPTRQYFYCEGGNVQGEHVCLSPLPLGFNFFHHEKARIQESLHAVYQAALFTPRESSRGRARDASEPKFTKERTFRAEG